MSNKQERTAMNLTKLCHELNIRKFTEPMATVIYEMAKDANCCCIEPTYVKSDKPTYVVIPEKKWFAAYDMDKDTTGIGEYGEYYFRKMICDTWYEKAMIHEF